MVAELANTGAAESPEKRCGQAADSQFAQYGPKIEMPVLKVTAPVMTGADRRFHGTPVVVHENEGFYEGKLTTQIAHNDDDDDNDLIYLMCYSVTF